MKTTTFTNTEKKAIKINKIYLLLFIICLPLFTLAQLTYVPDDNFEDYLESHSMGNGIANDDYVLTSNINTVTYLSLNNENISDLTGIEDFRSEEHTSELQSRRNLVCRLLLDKKKNKEIGRAQY